MRSVDASQEVKTYDTAESQTFVHPVEEDLVRALRMLGEGSIWTALAPSGSIYRVKVKGSE